MTTLSSIITPTNLVTLTGAATLTNKTIDAASNTLTGVATLTGTQTLTNKTIDAASNTLTGVATLTGTQTLTNKTLTGYTETVFALTGTTPALSVANGTIQTWTLSGNSTPTDSLTTGQSLLLQITPGAFTITWPSVSFTKVGGGGAAPTLFAAGNTSIILFKIGSTLFGSTLGDV